MGHIWGLCVLSQVGLVTFSSLSEQPHSASNPQVPNQFVLLSALQHHRLLPFCEHNKDIGQDYGRLVILASPHLS